MTDENNQGKPRLGEILVARGLAPREQVASVLSQPSKGKLASELYRLGVASERALALGLAEQRGHPAVVLSESSIDLGALELVPRVIAEQHRLLPIAVDAETLTIAVAELSLPDGRRPAIFDQIEYATGRKLHTLLAVETVVSEAIAIAYDAHRAGETVLVGQTERPADAPSLPPLAVVRPPGAPLPPDTTDPLYTPTPAPVSAPVVVGAPLGKPTVLVVDDEDDIRFLLKKVLTYDGIDVVEAATDRQALDLLRTLRPSCILLDAMLPEVHGFDICSTLKQSAAFKDTPVVVISAVYRGFEHARTVQETHGADAFIEKPFDVHYVRQLVARLVGKSLPKAQLTDEWVKKIDKLREECEVAYQMNDLAHAEDAIRRWRALDPFDATAYLMQGNCRFKARDFDGAMKAYERAATFDGNMFAAYKNLAVVYEQLGFAQRSLMAWYRAYELTSDPENRRRIEEHLARRQGQ